jgi:hypothetical protein
MVKSIFDNMVKSVYTVGKGVFHERRTHTYTVKNLVRRTVGQ